jgi:hypothetical protein
MTKQDVLKDYKTRDGHIVTPGKFEGEPVYVPVFWDRGLDGCADLDESGVYAFEVTNEDVTDFPELEGVNTLALEESETGFVNSSEWQSLAILERHLEQISELEDDEPQELEDEDITTSDDTNFRPEEK